MAPSKQEQDEKDRREKRAARRSRNGDATLSVASDSLTNTSSQGSPGAVAVSAESEAARMDQRIADRKQERAERGGNSINTNSSVSGTASKSSTNSTGSSVKQGTMTSRNSDDASPASAIQQRTSQLERDVLAKQQAQQHRRAQSSRPGAYDATEDASSASASSSKPGAHAVSGRLEDVVSAKARGVAPGRATGRSVSGSASTTSSLGSSTTPGARAEPAAVRSTVSVSDDGTGSEATTAQTSLDKDVAAKTRARAFNAPSSSAPGAVSVLSSLEDRAMRKARGEDAASLATGVSRTSGNSTLDTFERDVLSKTGEGSAPRSYTPGAVMTGSDQLSVLEDEITNKIRSSQPSSVHDTAGTSSIPGARSEPRSLEECVTSKVQSYTETTTKPGSATASQTYLEDVVTVKAATTTGSYSGGDVNSAAPTELESLEERILRKTDPYRDDDKEDIDPADAGHDYVKREQHHNKIAMDTEADKEINPPHQLYGTGRGSTICTDSESSWPGRGHNGQVPNPDVEHGVYNQTAGSYNGTNNEGLAVAVPVNEDERDAFIPSAVEYDPDAKPPRHSSKRFRYYAGLAIFVLVAAAIAAAVGVTLGQKKALEEQTPTAAPTTTREGLGIRATVQNLVGEEALTNEKSPYAKALEWITNEDLMMLSPTAPNFVQRYLMAYFYFATTVDGPWTSCNPPNYEEGERSFCYYKYVSDIERGEYETQTSTRWLSQKHECTWAFVTCDKDNQLRRIALDSQSLSGSFPEGVKYFPYLQALTLVRGNLRGPLPTSLKDIKHLLSIDLSYNKFTGKIPAQWWEARKLTMLKLGNNDLVGTVSSAIGQLQDLKNLYLNDNGFTGGLPKEIGNLQNLAFFRFGRNAFEGALPSELGKLTNLRVLRLNRNKFSGSIPPELGNLKFLNELDMGYNELSGSIPEEFWKIGLNPDKISSSGNEAVEHNFAKMDLSNNQLIGTLSSSVGKMLELNDVFLNNNQFTGQIPTSLGLLTKLMDLELQGNNFSGEMPSELCAIRRMRFKVLVADCAAPSSSGGAPKVTCSDDCCTKCCPGKFC